MRKISMVRRSKWGKRTRKLALILFPAAAIAVIAVAFAIGHRQNGNAVIATVNGEPIYQREYKQELLAQRNDIIQYFASSYGAEYDASFWNRSFSGEVPSEKAKESALSACVEKKIQQIMAKKKGIKTDIRYTTFVEEWKAENRRRAEAVKNGEAIYGPVEYQESAYFNDVFAKMVLKLNDRLAGEDIPVNEETLKTYYAAIKNKYYRNESTVTIQKIFRCYVDKNGSVSEQKKSQDESAIKQAKARLDSGEAFEDVARAYNESDEDKKSSGKQTFDESTARVDYQLNPELRQVASGLSPGQVSDIFKAANGFYIIRCADVKDNEYQPFSEVKDNVKSKYIDEKYKELVLAMQKDAEIIINDTFFLEIKMN